MTNKNVRLAVGLLTGLVGLIGMVRLVSGAFSDSMSVFAWVFVSLAMIPWVGYCAWRARHGHLRRRWGLVAVGFGLPGLILVWLYTIGAVLALACSLVGFAIIWMHDWPPRRLAAESGFVRIDELTSDATLPEGDR